MNKYILNIKTGSIHDAQNPCSACKRMVAGNKKFFDDYDKAENYFEGDKKGEPCGICFGGHRPNLEQK